MAKQKVITIHVDETFLARKDFYRLTKFEKWFSRFLDGVRLEDVELEDRPADSLELRCAVRLRELETEAERIPLDDVIAFLASCQYSVQHNLDAGIGEDKYTVSHGYTEKGVRHAWALAQLLESLHGEKGRLDENEADEMPYQLDVVLESFGENKVAVIKFVKDFFGCGLAEAKEQVESVPTTFFHVEQGGRLVRLLNEAGGVARIGPEQTESQIIENELVHVLERCGNYLTAAPGIDKAPADKLRETLKLAKDLETSLDMIADDVERVTELPRGGTT